MKKQLTTKTETNPDIKSINFGSKLGSDKKLASNAFLSINKSTDKKHPKIKKKKIYSKQKNVLEMEIGGSAFDEDEPLNLETDPNEVNILSTSRMKKMGENSSEKEKESRIIGDEDPSPSINFGRRRKFPDIDEKKYSKNNFLKPFSNKKKFR